MMLRDVFVFLGPLVSHRWDQERMNRSFTFNSAGAKSQGVFTCSQSRLNWEPEANVPVTEQGDDIQN